ILFNFYAIVMLVIGLIRTFWSSSEKERTNKQTGKQVNEHDYHRSGIEKELSTVKAQPWNLIVPLFLLLGLSLFLLWQNGMAKGANNVFQAFSEADATFVMLLAVFIARQSWTNKQTGKQGNEHDYHRSGIEKELSTVKAQPWNLIVPLFLLLGLSLFLLWQNGMAKGANNVFQAFSEADATFVMLLAVF